MQTGCEMRFKRAPAGMQTEHPTFETHPKRKEKMIKMIEDIQ